MKRIIALAIIIAALADIRAYAAPQYNENTQKLLSEAGLGYDSSWESVSKRQEELKRNQSAKSRTTQDYSAKSVDTGSQNHYSLPDERFSNGFDELKVNENYLKDVWHPADRGYRIPGFDELRFPDEM